MNELIGPEGELDLEEAIREENRSRNRQFEELRRSAQAVYRAVEGWPFVRDWETWLGIVEKADAEYQSGRFLIERLGAERQLDPALMATLWRLRQELLDESGASTATETMLVDMAVLGYHNALRIQGWIGNLALRVEHELFGQDSPAVAFRRENGRASGLVVEEHVQRLAEQMLPLLDRANRMMIRNLKAAKELRRQPVSNVAIGRADQVNIGNQQINAAIRQDQADGEK